MPTVAEQFVGLVGTDPLVQALVAGVVIAAMNTAGALLVFVWRDPAERSMDAALGFAAGGMLFVISDEIIPETHTHGHERVATMGTMVGLVVMLSLDVALTEVPL